jgi:ABC-2 type transport system permease protein
MGSMMLALVGLVTGIWAQDFDRLGAIQNFVVMPATFLSGTFFSLNQLPGAWKLMGHLNPFFYVIDGFRYGFTGIAEGSLTVGFLLMAGLNVALFALAYAMFATGYKLKS